MAIDLPNMDDVEGWSGGGGIFPFGDHRVRVTSAKQGTSTGGHNQFELELVGVDGEAKGMTQRDWITITENTLGRVKAALVAFGIPTKGGKLEASVFVGREAVAIIRPDAKSNREPRRDGLQWPRVVGYNPIDEARPSAFDKPAAAKSGGSSFDSDDIPFAQSWI